MENCDICKRVFYDKNHLLQHKQKNPNCKNQCLICLKYYSSPKTLKKHEYVTCVQKFKCNKCDKNYTTRFRLNNHICDYHLETIVEHVDQMDNKLGDLLEKIANNRDKPIIINNHITNTNINNNEIELNNHSKNHKVTNEIKIRNKNKNFFNCKPRHFGVDYNIDNIDIHLLKSLHNYTEDMADKYMYEEKDFRARHKDFVYQYDKDK